jgi:hypothetical protein
MKKLFVLAYILMSTTSGWASISPYKNHSMSSCPKALLARTIAESKSTEKDKQKARAVTESR